MIINVQQFDLQKAIERAEKLIHKKSTLPVLDSVKLTAENNKITLTVDNLDSRLAINLDGDIIDNGSVLIDKSNFKLIKKLSGCLNISSNDNKGEVIIKANRTLKFTSFPADEYPEFKDNTSEEAFIIPENVFKNNLKIKAFASSDNTRPIFCSVAIKGNDMVGCNNFFLSKITLNVQNKCDKEMIIPLQSINELDKILNNKSEKELKFCYAKGKDRITQLKISGEDFVYFTRLIDGNYMEYSRIIPTEFKTFIIINKDKLYDAVDFAKSIVKDDPNNKVLFNINKDEFKFNAIYSNKSMSEIIPAEIKGEELKILFDNSYIETIIKTIEEDNIKISFTGQNSPAIIEGEGNNNELYLICPVRMTEEYNNVA